MEKIIVISSPNSLSKYDTEKLQDYLDKGWKIKNMDMAATKDWVNLVVVIEKE